MAKRGPVARKPAGAGIAKKTTQRPGRFQPQAAKRVTVQPIAPKPSTGGRHTLILMQTAGVGSRTWSDFATLQMALEHIISIFEKEIRKLNPSAAQITYSVADLHTYVDSLADVSLMTLDPQTKQYAPKGKDYVKSQLMQKLKSAAA